jgi:hypothetical protein
MKTTIKLWCDQAFRKGLKVATVVALTLLSTIAWSQPTVPFTLVNRTNPAVADANIYVAVVGEQPAGFHVWVDVKTGQVKPMSVSDNTVAGPTPNGNMGPGGNGRYANCFSRLSEIPNKIINIPGIAGCRILISFNQQLYLYFFGASGAPSGYAAPDLNNPNDPNQGIRFENIELTNAPNGLWVNTTRVDTYQYPMGLEVWGNNSFYEKVGELKTHAEILSQWQSQAPAAFASCYDAAKGIILFPSKTAAFKAGGAQANYFQSYIDQIWSKYTAGDLVFNAGDAGSWRGRVSGAQFRFTRSSDGAVGIIPSKPTTQDALEAKGALATGGQWDLVMQAQIAAAINRHAIDLNLAVGATQDFGTPSKYYVTSPYNWYARFWHQTDISFNSKTYAFSYDDVFSQSSTINSGSPLRATVTIGGFAGTACTPTTISPNLTVNGGAWQATGNATLNAGGSFTLGPQPATGGSWSWTGPGGFTATTREITRTNVTTAMGGQYVARYTNTCGAQSTYTFNITINAVGGVTTVYQDCNYGGAAVGLAVGDYNLAAMTSRGIANDWISSLRVTSGYKVTLYENDGFAGASLVVTADNSCLVGAGWNDRASSMRVASNTTSFSTVIQAENWISMAGVQTETTTDAGGGLNVGWIEAGDWMAYNVTIPTTGTYRVIYRIATPNANMTLRLEKDAGATQLGTVTIPNTGGWQNWSTVAHNVTLPAGTYSIGIATSTGGFNINYFTITNNLSARFRTDEQPQLQEGEESLFVLSPNPMKDQLFINGFEKVKNVKIYDATGKQMISVENPGQSISVQSLKPGLHIGVVERLDRTVKKEKLLKE